jgi:hypothetical protein
MVTVVAAVTVWLFNVKVAELAPAGMVRELGPLATPEFDVPNVTARAVGAGPLRVTVPVPEDPPVIELGIVRPVRFTAGLTVTVADALETPLTARIVAVVLDVTFPALTVNVAELAPGGMVIEPGTLAALELVVPTVTTRPPEGAGAVRVTIPVAEEPPITAAGLIDSAETKAAGFTVTCAD